MRSDNIDSFKKKLHYSKALIREALKKFKNPVIACSFGKDSMVVLDMLKKYSRNFTVLWNNTLVEYPDTYKFAREIIKDWELDCVEARPKVTFWEIVEKYGFPIYSRNSKGHKQYATYKCCEELKKKPTTIALRNMNCDLYFTGLTRHESRLREFSARLYGDSFYSKTWKHWKCHPILNWTREDVWEYIRVFNIPYNPLYDKNEIPIDGGIRTGCWPCTQAIKYGKLEHLRTYYPELFNLLVVKKKFGEVMLDLRIEKYKDIKSRNTDYMRNRAYKQLGLEKTLTAHPCFFDRL
ncbi:phosphoadenosine phosphosulfate reductase family protein [candidate division WOR-3 bacterium]|nr:phosphoadenosine phosphosulfate reductase family protein [candidate division WOR-3 bacterium]